jgi:MFS family permease
MQGVAPLIVGLGIAQIVSWGTLYYAIGVLGGAMARDVGVSELIVFGSFTGALLVSGTLSPAIGRLIDRHGGRVVLSAGSAAAALAMLLLALAFHPALLLLGWLVAGAAMAACLYDPAFATLSQHTGPNYRRAVTALTLFGGFASTAFWPLSHVLMGAWGWRVTLAIFAGIHIFVCLPIHLLLIPRRRHSAPDREALQAPVRAAGLGYLAIAFSALTFASAVITVHFVSLLAAKGLTQAQAVSLGMLIGPAQVAGRILEFAFAARLGIVQVGFVALVLVLLSVIALMAASGAGLAVVAFVVLYGFGNGIFTIVRGAVPAQLYGTHRIGAILGTLARPELFSRAIAPAVFSGLLTMGVTRDLAEAVVATVVVAAIASYAVGVRAANAERRPPG